MSQDEIAVMDGGKCGILVRQFNFVQVEHFILRYHLLPFPARSGQKSVHVKGILLVGDGKVLIAGMLGNIKFLR